MKTSDKENTEFDVVVVGSGAGALAAALRAHDVGLRALVIEKSDKYGGTSALSGGGVWIPNNHQIAALGGSDSFDEALTYVKAAVGDTAPEDRIRTYLQTAPMALRYLEEKTRVRFHSLPRYTDYYPHLPGWKPGYRTMEPAFFPAGKLGKEFANQREPAPGTLVMGRMMMGQDEAKIMFCREPGWQRLILRILLKYWLDLPWRWRSKRDRRLALGSALMAALRASMLDRNIPLWLSTPLKSLVHEQGRVAGVVVHRNGREVKITARRGVVLAAGGFERNEALRRRHLPNPTQTSWSATPPNNTGDALMAAQALGAAVSLMDRAWWVPTIGVPGEPAQRPIFVERASPGCIVVNKLGKRFINESAPYLEFVDAMYADRERTGGSVHVWIVFDAEFRRKYPFGPLMPSAMQPDEKLPADWLGKVYFRAPTLAALAAQIGVDAAGLEESARRMNEYAETGVDTEFGKGNPFDRYYGDPAVKPNPCLGPVRTGPFYAMRLDAGDIGTKGGLVTDGDAQVLKASGEPIVGLYAIGNTAASVMGATYPGPGSTLGPAITFGFRAANHMAAKAG
jgi:3-oxosteroid 1-dehydrogenase